MLSLLVHACIYTGCPNNHHPPDRPYHSIISLYNYRPQQWGKQQLKSSYWCRGVDTERWHCTSIIIIDRSLSLISLSDIWYPWLRLLMVAMRQWHRVTVRWQFWQYQWCQGSGGGGSVAVSGGSNSNINCWAFWSRKRAAPHRRLHSVAATLLRFFFFFFFPTFLSCTLFFRRHRPFFKTTCLWCECS